MQHTKRNANMAARCLVKTGNQLPSMEEQIWIKDFSVFIRDIISNQSLKFCMMKKRVHILLNQRSSVPRTLVNKDI